MNKTTSYLALTAIFLVVFSLSISADPGCCVYNYADKNHCAWEDSKWLCEVSAYNRNIGEFHFDDKTDEKECEFLCSQSLQDKVMITSGLVKEKVNPPTENAGAKKEVKKSAEIEEENDKEEGGNNILYWLVAIFLIGAIFHFFHRSKFFKSRFKKLTKEISTVDFPKWYHAFFPNPVLRKKVEKLKKEHLRKHKENKRALDLGKEIKKKEKSFVGKLESLTKIHEKSKKWRYHPSYMQRKTFKNLDEVVILTKKSKELKEAEEKKIAEKKKRAKHLGTKGHPAFSKLQEISKRE